MGRRHRKKIPQGTFTAGIESLSHEGRGVAHVEGKTIFIDNALAGEQVEFEYTVRRSKFDQGFAIAVKNSNAERVEPPCEYYGYCGGCSLQHLSSEAQLAHKQAVLIEQFEHLGNVKPKSILPPLTGPTVGYRHKARLAVKYVLKKEKVLVGFREKRSPFVADIDSCKVLHPAIGEKFSALQILISGLSIYNQIPQIEVAVTDEVLALVFRHLEDFTQDDIQRLSEFEQTEQCRIYLQPGGYDTIHTLTKGMETDLSYDLKEHDVTIYFAPTDFTQINVEINQQMVSRAIEFLDLKEDDEVLDLFCGVGNFTLPIAKRVKSVVGVEGEATLVARAKENALKNNIDNAEFYVADLSDTTAPYPFMRKTFNKLLLDPARLGAKEIIEAMNLSNIEKIVYVSCNPATLARDAGILVNEKGFKLKQAGIMDMFPHTTHVESIAVFEKK